MTRQIELAPSYGALYRIGGFPRLVASMILARTATEMLALILVLFALQRYQSAAVAGAVVFLEVTPGLLLSPLAGALLDRHGRTRLMILDYLVAGGVMAAIGALALNDRLPVPIDHIDTPQELLNEMPDSTQVRLVVGRGRLGLEWLKGIEPIQAP